MEGSTGGVCALSMNGRNALESELLQRNLLQEGLFSSRTQGMFSRQTVNTV